MSSAGIVYEIYKNKVVVLSSDGEFIFVRKKNDMAVGQVIKYFETDIYAHNNRLSWYAPIAVGVAAILIFVVVFVNLFFGANRDDIYGFIDVDTGASVEFVFDNEYNVLKAVSIDGEAEKIVEGIELKGETVLGAVSKFVEKSELSGFKGKSTVLISAALNSKSKEYMSGKQDEEIKLDDFIENVSRKVKESSEKRGIDSISKAVIVSPEERDLALNYKLSMGKYHLFLKAKEQGLAIKIDELNNSKVSYLLEKIDLQEGLQTEDPKPELGALYTVNPDERGDPVKTISPINTPAKTNKQAQINIGSAKLLSSAPQMTPIKVLPTEIIPEDTPTMKANNRATPTPIIVATPEYTAKPDKQPEEVNDKIKIEFYSSDRLIKTQGVHVNFKIVNTGTTILDLEKVKVRYYLTREGTSKMRYAVYYFSSGNKTDIHGEFFTLSDVVGTDNYLEITFDTGSVSPGKPVYIEGEILMADWSYFDQSNDYSFNPIDKSYVEWDKMTAFVSDVLVWGIEPT